MLLFTFVVGATGGSAALDDLIMKIFCLFPSDDGVRLDLNRCASCVLTVIINQIMSIE